MASDGEFSGKTVIITGAASGIGRATAQLLALKSANLVLYDKNEEGLNETSALIVKAGSKEVKDWFFNCSH